MKSALTASLLFFLFGFWLLLSGIYTPFLVTAGALSALAIALLSRRMGLTDDEAHPIRLAWGAIVSYWPWLVWEIIKSSWDVARRILHPGLPISPTLVEFSPSQKTAVGLVTHANSITLTPGTISIEVEPGRFLVHALTAEGAAGLAGSEMDRRCARLEGEKPC
jgi:multicomponent Na+:H+ antiporter subunit E